MNVKDYLPKDFNASNVLMFTVADHAFYDRFLELGVAKEEYAKFHEYAYMGNIDDFQLTANQTRDKPHIFAVEAAKNLMEGIFIAPSGYVGKEDNWLVYMDTDMAPAEFPTPIEFILALAYKDYELKGGFDSSKHNNLIKEINNKTYPMFFVAQDYNLIINSGFWMLRNCTQSRLLVQTWLDDFYTLEVLQKTANHPGWDGDWVQDQGPLMNAVMKHYSNEGNLKYGPDKYAYQCFMDYPNAFLANHCYHNTMHGWNYDFNSRSAFGIELLPDIGVPWSVMIHGRYQPGTWLWHCKYEFRGCGSLRYRQYIPRFHFDEANFRQVPDRPSIVRVNTGYAIYLLTGKPTHQREKLAIQNSRGKYDVNNHHCHIRHIIDADTLNSLLAINPDMGIMIVTIDYLQTCIEGPNIGNFDLEG